MTPDRWQQIERVYLAALECDDAKERRVFVEAACGNDAALREEVESLLSNEPDAAEFLETPGPNLGVRLPKAVLPRSVEFVLSKRLLQLAVVVPITLLVFSIVKNRDRTVAENPHNVVLRDRIQRCFPKSGTRRRCCCDSGGAC